MPSRLMKLTFAADADRPAMQGLSVEGDPWNHLQRVPGPTIGRGGVAALDGEVSTLRLKLDRPVGPRGTVVMWFRLDQPYHASPQTTALRERLLQLPGVATLDMAITPSAVTMRWEWAQDEAAIQTLAGHNGAPGQSYELKPSAIRAFDGVPGLPGPGWYQAIYTWDADKGLFERFLNGTPMQQVGRRLPPWQVDTPTDTMTVNVGRFALGDVWISDQVVDDIAAVSQWTPNIYRGTLNHHFGRRPAGQFRYTPDPRDLIYANPLQTPDSVADWVMEGPAKVEFENAWMYMHTPGETFESTFWCDTEFPADFFAQWTMQPTAHDRALCIVFFCATGKDGQDVLDPSLQKRAGEFNLYHSGDINCYHISYWAGMRPTSNMRKNPGFYLVENGPQGIPVGSNAVHTISLLKKSGRVQLAVDDRLIIDFHDDGQAFGPVYGAGKIGFRQVRWTQARYRDLRVYAVPAG